MVQEKCDWIDEEGRAFAEVHGLERRVAQLLGEQLETGGVRHSPAHTRDVHTCQGASSVPTAS